MMSEKEIRQILHEKKQERDFLFRIFKIDQETKYKDQIEELTNDIILLETILEKSAWQKLHYGLKKKRKSLVEITESGTFKVNSWVLARSKKFREIIKKCLRFKNER